jgi:hypothetical protein
MENLSKFKRDPETGLLVGFDYKFKEDDLIDYKQLIPAKFLYVPKDKEEDVVKKYGKPSKELDLTQIEDRYLAILLGGLRYLLNLRGYKAVHNKVDAVTYDPSYQMVAACTHTCTIEFIGNYETNMQPVTYSDSAGASIKSVSQFFLPFIETASANRALCRAIRGFLGLNIVSKEELAENIQPIVVQERKNEASTPSGFSPVDKLDELLKGKKISFETFKKTVVKHYKERIKENDPEKWESLNDIHPQDIWTILQIFKDSEKKSVTP